MPPYTPKDVYYITSPKVTYRAFRKKGISNRAKRDISHSSFVNVFRESEYIDSPKVTVAPTPTNWCAIDIALECGFGSERSFYRAFKEITGETPKKYSK